MALGKQTNNVAEYAGLMIGLEAAQQIGIQDIVVYGDSMLVINQVKGLWRCENSGLRPLLARMLQIRSKFTKFEAHHVYRDKNTVADELSNEALDSPGWDGIRVYTGTVLPIKFSIPALLDLKGCSSKVGSTQQGAQRKKKRAASDACATPPSPAAPHGLSKKHERQGRKVMGLTANGSLSGLLGQRSMFTFAGAASLLTSSQPPLEQNQAAMLPDRRHQFHLLRWQPCQPWPLRRRCFQSFSRCWPMGHAAPQSVSSNQLSRQGLGPGFSAQQHRPHVLVTAVGAAGNGTSRPTAARSRMQHACQAAIRAAKPRFVIGAARAVGRLRVFV